MTTASAMIVHSNSPFNAEPPMHLLCGSFITPQELFYVRSHGLIPDPASAEKLRLGGKVTRPASFTVADLQARFETVTLAATLQCAGNRRADLQAVGKTAGDPWQAAAVGNAEWTGVRLADLLAAAGVEAGGAHVAFTSRDVLEEHAPLPYAVSIPLEKAIAPEVVLAWAMNGAALTPQHGAPLRAVVPGYAGVRSAKWLRSVEVMAEPAHSPVQRQDYKLVPPEMDAQSVDWERGMTINALPVNSAICEPAPGKVPVGPCQIRGWAMASERSVARVDVSADGGKHWIQAALQQQGCWSWALWHAALDLGPGQHELVVRAWDDAGQTQPVDPGSMWNFKGYLCSAWHRVRVTAG